MKEVERKEAPGVSGGLSYPDDSGVPYPPFPYPDCPYPSPYPEAPIPMPTDPIEDERY